IDNRDVGEIGKPFAQEGGYFSGEDLEAPDPGNMGVLENVFPGREKVQPSPPKDYIFVGAVSLSNSADIALYLAPDGGLWAYPPRENLRKVRGYQRWEGIGWGAPLRVGTVNSGRLSVSVNNSVMDRLFAYEFSGQRQSEVRWGLSGLEDSRGTLLIKKFDVINGDEPGTRVRSSGYDYSVGFTSEKLVDFVVSHQTPEMQDRIRAAQTTEDSRMLLSAVRAIVAQAKAQIAADHDKAKANVALDGAIAAAGTDA
ncbi:TPA: hypothetical protein ACUNF5_007548, partial [Burkholderia orbicola]